MTQKPLPKIDLNNLTPAQQITLDGIRDKWLALGLSTDPANRPEAEDGIRQAYKDQGLRPPQFIFWVQSPYAGALAVGLIPAAIEAAYGVVEKAVTEAMDAPFGEATLKPYTIAEVPMDMVAVQDWWRSATYGQHSAAYYAYLESVQTLGIEELTGIDGPMKVAANASWWWPAEDFVIITERPNRLHLDAQQRLHCEDGLAIGYPDGWGLYMWHGMQVPRDLILGKWTSADILREQNTEIRRCAIEHMGWEKFILDAKLKKVGRDVKDPGNPGFDLSLYDIPERLYGEPVRVLLCHNATSERDGTRRRFGLTVPGEIKNPMAAAAWTFGLDEATYRTLVRAT